MATEEQQQALRSSLVSLAISIGVVIALLFVPAGTLDWANGWVFTAIFLLLMGVAIVVLWRVNPDIFVARKAIHAGTKGWDYLYLMAIIGGLVAVPVVAGFDYRWSWAQAPAGMVWLGLFLFIAGFAGQCWAQGVNRHFEPTIRIQTDRGHKVIDTGPYAYIRHPGYVSGSALAVGMALALGSFLALLPAAVVIVALILRTNAEDQVLQRELPGYAEYALRVPFKWVPGMW
jgi:protein-S-isoprenylcysteine O-methyltransferase Ste14